MALGGGMCRSEREELTKILLGTYVEPSLHNFTAVGLRKGKIEIDRRNNLDGCSAAPIPSHVLCNSFFFSFVSLQFSSNLRDISLVRTCCVTSFRSLHSGALPENSAPKLSKSLVNSIVKKKKKIPKEMRLPFF